MRIYILQSDFKNNSFFLQDKTNDDGIKGISMDWKWNKPLNYKTTNFKIHAGDNGKKNYKNDISSATSPFYIISESTWNALKDILENRGVLLDIITESKQKRFYGYYTTNMLPTGALNKELSDYTEYSNGILVREPVLNKSSINDDFIFTIQESISHTFVTEKFKERVEQAGLKGFDFSDGVKVVNL